MTTATYYRSAVPNPKQIEEQRKLCKEVLGNEPLSNTLMKELADSRMGLRSVN